MLTILATILCILSGVIESKSTNQLERSPNTYESSRGDKYAMNSIEYRLADATNRFGLLFMNNLDTTKSNAIYSPVSLQAILSMVYLGAQQNSSSWRELAQGLGYEELNLMGKEDPHKALHSIYKDITDLLLLPDKKREELDDGETPGKNEKSAPLGRQKELNFTMTNLLLTNSNLVNISKDYHATLDKYYTVKHVQFRRRDPSQPTASNLSLSQPEPIVLEVEGEQQLADVINQWVGENTNHKIENMVQGSDLPLNDLVLALVNSAYLQGNWLNKFDEHKTKDQAFYNEGREDHKKTTKFMRKSLEVPYAKFMLKSIAQPSGASASQQPAEADLDCQAIEIPFAIGNGKELSMLVLLPTQRQGIDKLQRSLTWSTLRGIYSALKVQDVQVEIPKFTLEQSYDVKSILERMGIRSVFDATQAKLTEMLLPRVGSSSSVTFNVDKIKHKAKIEVHESGAEAAASTYATVSKGSVIFEWTPRFIADHPFIFIIRHNRSSLPMFMGRVNHV